MFMAVLNNVRNRMADIGDHVSAKFGRTARTTGAFVSGTAAYGSLMQSSESFYAKEMLDTQITFKDLRTMNAMARHVAAFNENRLSRIFSRYADNPKRLNKIVSMIVKEFSSDITNFLSSYNQFIKVINDELVKRAEELHSQDDFIAGLLKRLAEEIEKEELYIPKSMVEHTKKEIARLLKKEFKFDRLEMRDDALLESGGKIRRGFMFFSGMTYIKHKTKKHLKKLHKDEHKDFVKNIQVLENQLDQHKVQVDFLSRMINHIKNLEHIVFLIDELSRDIKRFIQIANEDYDVVKTSLAKFLAIFKNTDAVSSSNIGAQLKELYEVHEKMKKVLEDDKLDDKNLALHIKNISAASSHVFSTLETMSSLIMEELEKNPDKFLKNIKT